MNDPQRAPRHTAQGPTRLRSSIARAGRSTVGSHTAVASLIAVAALVLSGCASLPAVQPWEKGHLAKPAMGFDPDKLDAAYVEHTYSSKEGVFGGAAVGGGGCGCN